MKVFARHLHDSHKLPPRIGEDRTVKKDRVAGCGFGRKTFLESVLRKVILNQLPPVGVSKAIAFSAPALHGLCVGGVLRSTVVSVANYREEGTG